VARCFVSRQLPGTALERLAETHDVDIWPGPLPPPHDELLERVKPVAGLLSMLSDRVDADLIAAAPHLRAIANYAVGYDNIDLDAAAAREIPVGNTPDVLTDATADLAFALLMAAARKLTEADAAVREGDWQTWEPERYLGADVHGATIGIIGFGRIGRAVAERAAGFEMRVLVTTRGSGPNDLESLLEQSDFVSVHAPLTPETRHLIGAHALAVMKPSAILINTARGELVDQAALTRALNDGLIAGAALDTTTPEPLPSDDPLLQAPNLIVTPHIGSATRTARERMADLAVDNLLAALDGQPMPHQVTAA
jgi:glyoxylate reductase